MRKVSFIIFIVYLTVLSDALSRCKQEQFRKFHKVKICSRSNSQVITKANALNVQSCMDFARERNGFALNFGPPDLSDEYFNCHVLACPETMNLTTLVNDTNFDYYSSFANLQMLDNTTCIKSLGVFRLFQEKQNYSTAILQCQLNGGDLANILTESRTNHLANLIGSEIPDWFKAAYVGLDDRKKEGVFVTALDEPIGCYKFRAWSPGHPRNRNKREDCAILDNDKTWKVVDCKIKLPFVCELYPEGPGKSNDTFNTNCVSITDKDLRRECRMIKRRMNEIEVDNDPEDRCNM